MDRDRLREFILETYGVEPDHPWADSPTFEVFRHQNNKKWFALVMDIPRSRVGRSGDEMIDLVNLKCDPAMIGSLRLEKGFFPAYHMSKEKWISVALDGSVDGERIKSLVDLSFELTGVKLKKKKLKTGSES